MSVQLNHTIVWCRDKRRSAPFLAETLGLPAPTPFGPFLVVESTNSVSLDYHDTEGEIAPQHYAFLVGEGDFDGTTFTADPAHGNCPDGGAGFAGAHPILFSATGFAHHPYAFLTPPGADDLAPTGGLASSWECAPDGLTWTFTLREDYKAWPEYQTEIAGTPARTIEAMCPQIRGQVQRRFGKGWVQPA